MINYTHYEGEPYKAYNSAGGVRVVQIHYSADPEKTEDWATKERPGWFSGEWNREMELDDSTVAGAMWTQQLIDACRIDHIPSNKILCAVAVDPTVTNPELARKLGGETKRKPDECGIGYGYLLDDNRAVVAGDLSGVLSPNQWAQVTVGAFNRLRANKVIAEKNQGGELVRLTINSVGPAVPVELVHAAIGKRARAEPVVALYEQGRILHYWPKGKPNPLAKLEREMCTWDAMNPSAPSPNRVDWLVWLMHGLGLCSATGMRVHSRLDRNDDDDF